MIEARDEKPSGEVLRYGMVGGGEGAFIGDVHRKAIGFDRKAVLDAGCFSRNYENTLATGKDLGISTERLYRSFKEMAEKEAARNDKIDFVSIVTPNYAHYEVAKTFLENGINVVCDKPLCFEISQAEELDRLAVSKDLLFGVTYTYSGYPMVKQAREMIRRGDIGEIRVVMGEYPQDWLAVSVEKAGNRQASWRTDPQLSGISNCVGDIGSHIENTIAYITGLRIKSLCANLDSFGEGRVLDDNAEVLVRYVNGATGVYWSSQVAIGHENGLKVRIFGTKGSIEWEQENPNYLKATLLGEPVRILSRGSGYLYPQAAKLARIPAGHPEGYYEAFANIYSAFIDALLKKKSGRPLGVAELDFPNAGDGISGMKFINKCVESSQKGAVWVSLE
jgi:predicted dehydrogenase